MVVEKAAEAASKAVSNDIAVLRTRFDVAMGKGRKKRLTPVEAELHVNPVSIAVAAAAALLGTLAGTVAWHGINIPAPLGGAIELMPGIKDTALGQDITSWYARRRLSPEERKALLEAKREATKPRLPSIFPPEGGE